MDLKAGMRCEFMVRSDDFTSLRQSPASKISLFASNCDVTTPVSTLNAPRVLEGLVGGSNLGFIISSGLVNSPRINMLGGIQRYSSVGSCVNMS